MESLGEIPEVKVIDHGDFYEISLTEAPFGNINVSDSGEGVSGRLKLDTYYSAIGLCIAGVNLY